MRVALIASFAAAVATGSVGTALGAAQQAAPAKDSFRGRISGAAGHYDNDHGIVSVLIGTRASARTTRPVKLTIRGGACGRSMHRLELGGTATGTLTGVLPRIHDIGEGCTVTAVGTIEPFDRVSVEGSVHGTGFIDRGHETLELKLSAAHGKVTLMATSGSVPGFTSP